MNSEIDYINSLIENLKKSNNKLRNQNIFISDDELINNLEKTKKNVDKDVPKK